MSSRLLKILVTADVAGLQAGMAKAQASVSQFDKELQQNAARRQAIDDLGTSFGKVGLLSAAGVALATKSAMDWETAWAGVTKTVEGSASQMATLEGQLRDMATSMPATHQEIAAVAQAAGALGVATPDVAEFTRTMVMLSEATDDLTADQAATSMAQLMNVMQTGPDDVDNLANALVRLGNNGASTEGQILQLAQNLAGAGATIGLAESDVLGIANALASVGIEAEAGGSAVSKILIDMATAAKTGSPELAKWADASNMTAESFQQLMAEDPAAAFTAFTEGLGKINAEGGDVFTLLSELGQSDVRVTRALLGMAGAGDMLSQSLADSADAYANGTDAVDEYEKRSQTAAAQIQVAWNGIKDNLIDIGAAALPAVKDLSSAIADLTGWFSDLPDGVQESTLRFMALTAAIGGVGYGVSRAVTGFASMAESLNALTGNAEKLSRTQLFARGGALVAGTALAAVAPAAAEANDALGVLSYTASGALIGTAILPGWGTAIGGVAGAAWGVVDAMNAAKDSGVDAGAVLEAGWDQLAQTLVGVAASVTEATRATAAATLQESGLAADARDLGLSLREVVDVSLGVPGAIERMDAAVATSGHMNSAAYRNFRGELTGLSGDFEQTVADTVKLNLATLDLTTALAGLPPEVIVDLQNRNFDLTLEEIQALQAQYDLTPEVVETLALLADDQAVAGVANMNALLFGLDGTTATPDANLNDNASGSINNIQGKLWNLNGASATVHVNAVVSRTLSGIPGAQGLLGGLLAPSANGNIFDFYANGGMRENHVAQIAPAGAWRVWAEPETEGEAYIPFAQSKRQRSLDIWAETGKRLGVQQFANGGINGRIGSVAGGSKIEQHFHITAPAETNTQQLANWLAGETAFAARGSGQGGGS